jgi:hypothetical protein
MMSDLLQLRALLTQALAILERMLAGQPSSNDGSAWRKYPRGPLNEAGVTEMERRLVAGESDSTIALGMSVSLDGVSKRRSIWRRKSA